MLQEGAVDESNHPRGSADPEAVLLQHLAQPEVQRLHLHPKGMCYLPLALLGLGLRVVSLGLSHSYVGLCYIPL